jgi:hypothetical protein
MTSCYAAVAGDADHEQVVGPFVEDQRDRNARVRAAQDRGERPLAGRRVFAGLETKIIRIHLDDAARCFAVLQRGLPAARPTIGCLRRAAAGPLRHSPAAAAKADRPMSIQMLEIPRHRGATLPDGDGVRKADQHRPETAHDLDRRRAELPYFVERKRQVVLRTTDINDGLSKASRMNPRDLRAFQTDARHQALLPERDGAEHPGSAWCWSDWRPHPCPRPRRLDRSRSTSHRSFGGIARPRRS